MALRRLVFFIRRRSYICIRESVGDQWQQISAFYFLPLGDTEMNYTSLLSREPLFLLFFHPLLSSRLASSVSHSRRVKKRAAYLLLVVLGPV